MEDIRLDGRTVIVTGGNTGIGKETALDMARRGARVILACRDQARADAAAKDIVNQTGNNNVVVGLLDLSSLESVREFSKNIINTEQRLDILINNAGIMACPQWKTKEGYEMQFGVNHLGHFLLTQELLDLLKASAPSRIVNVSSAAHKGGKINFDDINLEKEYTPFKAYSQSKLANILFTRELHRKLQGTGVTTYSLHPGVVKTELFRNFKANCCTMCCIKCLMCCFSCCMKNPDNGALTTIHCAVREGIEGQSGLYFADCAVKTTAPQAVDDTAATQLWELSEEMVKAGASEQAQES